MASIRKEFSVALPPAAAWAALRDFGAVHRVLAVGFVSDCVLEEEGAVRQLTFANGVTARERLVDIDDARRRIVYTSQGGRATHHNASAEVLAEGTGSRFVWITDVLPDALAPALEGMMEAGARAMQATLERGAR
ncbi:SRPBCC family protein [Ramlibacter terrae]|uniref:SRPBCC family protein n=1 Tax=Ramlibacter terrae TaxID=2732511 RepID=A0ABX6P1L9_9BURK|nr:SRPBCC family protein [Ramlibacter terrae]